MSQITYHGHSTFLIEVDQEDSRPTRILVDPFFTENPVAAVAAEEIEADYIFVTHGHFDHVGHIAANPDGCETDLVNIAKRTGATVICSFEIAVWLGSQGVETAHAMGVGGSHTFPIGRVHMTPAVHSAMLPDGSNGGLAAGFVIELPGTRLYFAGDTALFSDMALLGAHEIDIAVLPIGDNFTMGPDDAVTAAEWTSAKHVIPCHYDTWPPISQDAAAFAEALFEKGIEAHVLGVSASLPFPI